MIFGRRKRQATDEYSDTDAVAAPEAVDDLDESYEEAQPDAAPEEISEHDEWVDHDMSQDWRAEGPFDISEVDLDADDVARADFGTLIVTPFEGIGLQLQMNQSTQQAQALLAQYGQSVLEISLFAAPADRTVLATVRSEIVADAKASNGSSTLAKGPFGTEVRRVVPIVTAEGKHGYYVSRTWLVQGPRWVLRGVITGEAGMAEGHDGVSEPLYEFFANTVVRRGNKPMVPSDAIPLVLPDAVRAQLAQQAQAQ